MNLQRWISAGPGAPKTLPSWIEESDIDFYGEEFKRSGLRKIQMLPGCGHWTQQERPNEVSAALVEFIRTLPSR